MPVSISDVTIIKRLIAVGNDKVYYEDLDVAAGTMTELTTTGNAIDTSDQLNMFEGYQKVFVVNGANLKVADFINTKISDDAGFTNKPARGSIVYQAGIDAATMLVDYIHGTDKVMYGYVTSGTFEADTAITSAVGGGGNVIFPSPAASSSSPSWYSWTPYDNDTETYGELPAKAYLGCLYRGRPVLSGNPAAPYQWYMARQGNPWDWAYTPNDAQAPVAGGNSLAGELGDVVRCLIPYKDDYLIFGCANSVWVLRGDAAIGGTIDEVDSTAGIYGAYSWCFDGQGNLYFFGTNGIYMLPAGFGPIQNLTEFSLPNLISDRAANPASHRITMGFDRIRNGVVVCITKRSDGTNYNYFFDMKTKGFFPEIYPEECGVYSLFFYDSNNKTYTDLLYGSMDGYIREMVDTATDDDTGASSTEKISSYVTWPIQQMAEEDRRGKLTSLTFELAGGAANGDFSDTDVVTYSLYAGDDAETVLEDIKDGTATSDWTNDHLYSVNDLVRYLNIDYICIVEHTSEEGGDTNEEPDTNTTDWSMIAFKAAELSGTGRKSTIRPRMRGAYMGLKLSDSTASKTWAVNKVLVDFKPSGKVR